jgi:alkylation response protein AidB-like acyl-CoA dehydrogenase
MDLELTEEQELLRSTTARFIEATTPLENVRERLTDDLVHDRSLLPAASELGWTAFFVSEEHGGGSVSGAPMRDAAIVAEERGLVVQPGPFVGTNVVAAAVSRAGTKEQRSELLPQLAAGEASGAWVVSGPSGAPEPGAVTAAWSGDECILSGTARMVQEATIADVFLMSAADGRGATQFLVPAGSPGVKVRPVSGLDLTRRFAEVHVDGLEVSREAVLGAPGEAAPDIEAQVDTAAALTLAESVGSMRRLVEMTVEYARSRTAFGRPIGSFQALKHMLADASMHVEVCAAGSAAAARSVSAGHPAASELVSIAKAYAGDAGNEVAQICMQIHGGIGFTWEHDLHLYMRRLATDRVLYGDPRWHYERVCRLHGL